MLKILVIILAAFMLLTGAATPAASEGKAFIGVYLEELDAEEIEERGFDGGYGLLLPGIVEGGSAEEAGLEDGDLLLKLDGDPVYTSSQLGRMMELRKPGDKVKLEVLRNGKKMKFKFPLGEKKKSTIGKKAFIGVILGELSDKKREILKIGVDHGIQVTDVVDDGPAEEAGLEDGDVILDFDDVKVYTIDQLTRMLHNFKPEAKVAVTIFRDGKKKAIEVTLGAKAFDFPMIFDNDFPGNVFVYKYLSDNRKKLGILAEPLSGKDMKKFGVEHGVKVSKVLNGHPAEEAGMKKNDIIMTIGETKIEEIENISDALEPYDAGTEVDVSVIRDGKPETLKLKVAESDVEDIEERVEISVDDGKVRIMLDDGNKMLLDSGDLLQNLELHGLEELEEKCKQLKIECEHLKDAGCMKKMKILAPGCRPDEDDAF